MDRETGTRDGRSCLGQGRKRAGGLMVRGPNSGNGTQSPVYYLASTGLGPPRPRPPALGEVDPPARDAMDIEPDPRADEGWGGAGGRWLLWPLRAVLWAALLVIAFRGVTTIVFGQSSAPPAAGTGSASAKSAQFPVALAEAFAAEFGRVYLNFSPQTQGFREQQL